MIENTKVFVITLKKSKRTKFIKNRLKYLNIKYKIFYGIDGQHSKSKKGKKCKRYAGKARAPPELYHQRAPLPVSSLIQYKMSLENRSIPTQDEPEGSRIGQAGDCSFECRRSRIRARSRCGLFWKAARSWTSTPRGEPQSTPGWSGR